MVFNQSFHLLLDTFVPLSDVHVQGIVTAGFAVCPLSPLVERRQQTGARLGNHVVNWNDNQSTAEGLGKALLGAPGQQAQLGTGCCKIRASSLPLEVFFLSLRFLGGCEKRSRGMEQQLKESELLLQPVYYNLFTTTRSTFQRTGGPTVCAWRDLSDTEKVPTRALDLKVRCSWLLFEHMEPLRCSKDTGK